MRTARDFSSGGYLFDVFPDMTPTFPRFGVSRHAGAVQTGPTNPYGLHRHAGGFVVSRNCDPRGTPTVDLLTDGLDKRLCRCRDGMLGGCCYGKINNP